MRKTFIRRVLLATLTLLAFVPLMAQGQVKVTGVVSGSDGEPLIGASVIQKGTNNGVITDLDGNYAITVDEGVELEYSCIGYVSKTLKAVAGKVDVVLDLDNELLDEVVVVGYGVQKKSSVTGAISSVKAEDLQNRTITNAQQALQGKTSGVQIVQTSAAPGSSPSIRVRGYSSNAAASPLYVVDGVQMSSIAGIDPNDIESMEVLKDGASAAIYGAEAGNGVILITTKRGKAGQGKITYDMQYVSQSLARVPKMLNAEEYITYMSEAGTFDRDYLLKTWDGTTNTSWLDVAFGNSVMQKHNLAFTNGNEQGNIYVSLTYLDNNGIVKGDADVYNRLTASVNAEYKIKDWFKIGTTNQIEKYKSRSVSEGNEYGSMLTAMMMLDPLTPDTYTADNLPAHMLQAIQQGKTLLTNEKGEYYAVSQYYAGENYHPMIMRDNSYSTGGGFNVNGSLFAEFTPIKGLIFTSRFGYRLAGSESSSVSFPYYGNSRSESNYIGLSASSNTSVYYQWENFANYIKSFGRHTVTAMAGVSFLESYSNYVNGSLSANGEDAIKKPDQGFWYLNYPSSSATKGTGGESSLSAKYSYFTRLNYDYAGKYMLQASLRADAADLSKLPTTNRWGFFPAVSAGWTVSEEPFFQSLRRNVNSLKLRASWGQNGSLGPLGGYTYSTDMTSAGMYAFVPGNTYINGTMPASMGNDKLSWETSEQLNFGVDARFLNNRLTASLDVYSKQTKDLLVYGTTPSLVVGGTTSPLNAGAVSNKGLELDLGWQDQIGDFYYNIRGNIATLKNKVTYLDPSIERIGGAVFHNRTITYFEEGYPVYYFRGYKFTGIDSATGEPTFEDADNSGEINESDATCLGDAIPDFTYGLTFTAAWKGFDLTVFGTGSQGNKIFNCFIRPDYPSSNKMKDIFYNNRWTPTNNNGTVPRAGASGMEYYMFSDALIFDGSFFKIKQIQLGYSLPQDLLRKAKIESLRLYCSLDDYFTFTKYCGFDPEVSNNSTSGMGIDKGAYPASKKLVLGLNISF